MNADQPPIVSVMLRTKEYRGDHDAEVGVVCEVRQDETVQQLAERLLKSEVDWIEVRIVRLAGSKSAARLN